MYYIVYGLLYLVSLLPLGVLYVLADLAYFFIFYIIGYRKKTVYSNLKQAFPEKTDEERKKIAKRFYHNFADSFIETIKLFSAGEAFIKERFKGDFSVLDYLYKEGRKCEILSSHNFNWEYANLGIPLNLKHTLLTVYMPIENKIFDRIFKKMRSKTGAVLLPANDTRKAILPYRNTLYALALVADQNPGDTKNGYWINFLNKPAPFVKAPESGARRGNIPVVFSYFLKEKRGYYRIFNILAEENPATTKPGELTVKYVRFLEDMIRENPEVWLWSHRRWKWDWKEEYGNIIT
ncbi:MAG TPA: lysophospholipid acyltransferase family protein [Chitinophagaceae bacterium]|nr:lysophospholipid acyltransferase family protein [Chitinophagaceae bacterium]